MRLIALTAITNKVYYFFGAIYSKNLLCKVNALGISVYIYRVAIAGRSMTIGNLAK